MILVTGASGQVGRELVKLLRARNIPFRAVVNKPASVAELKALGVEVIQADLVDRAALQKAFSGVEALFILPPGRQDQFEIEKNLIDLAKENKVGRIVKLSVIKAQDETVPLFYAHIQSEEYLKASGVSFTILRPNSFMQNFVRVDAATIKGMGQIFNVTGEHKISFIDTADIAAVALTALTTDQYSGQTLDLTGPSALNYQEVAEKFSQHLGRTITYTNLTDEAMLQAMVSNGVPEGYAGGLMHLYEFYRQDKGAVVTNHVTAAANRPSHSLDDFITANLATFQS